MYEMPFQEIYRNCFMCSKQTINENIFFNAVLMTYFKRVYKYFEKFANQQKFMIVLNGASGTFKLKNKRY